MEKRIFEGLFWFDMCGYITCRQTCRLRYACILSHTQNNLNNCASFSWNFILGHNFETLYIYLLNMPIS